MLSTLRDPSFLPSCILGGVGFVFVVLVAVLPPAHTVALVGGTAVALGLVLARLRRGTAEIEPATRAKARV